MSVNQILHNFKNGDKFFLLFGLKSLLLYKIFLEASPDFRPSFISR